MPQAETVSLNDHLAIGMQAIKLERQGKLEEVQALQHTMLLSAYLVKWVKKRFDAKVLIKTCWKLSDAEALIGLVSNTIKNVTHIGKCFQILKIDGEEHEWRFFRSEL